MPSSESFLQYVLDQIALPGSVTARKMMGEYLLYLHGRLIGGIYDDRFLLKNTDQAKSFLKNAPLQTPYPGAKEMILVTCLDEREELQALFRLLANE